MLENTPITIYKFSGTSSLSWFNLLSSFLFQFSTSVPIWIVFNSWSDISKDERQGIGNLPICVYLNLNRSIGWNRRIVRSPFLANYSYSTRLIANLFRHYSESISWKLKIGRHIFGTISEPDWSEIEVKQDHSSKK